MAQTIRAAQTESATPSTRRALADDLLDQLTGWTPSDREGMFRAWHRGALSLVHLIVLTMLEAHGPVSMTQLAGALDVSDASATGIVDRMERHGLVERRHAVADRRLVMVEPTAAGRAVFSDQLARRRERLARLLDELTEDELAGFLAGLRAMRAARARISTAEAAAAGGPTSGTELAAGASTGTDSHPAARVAGRRPAEPIERAPDR